MIEPTTVCGHNQSKLVVPLRVSRLCGVPAACETPTAGWQWEHRRDAKHAEMAGKLGSGHPGIASTAPRLGRPCSGAR